MIQHIKHIFFIILCLTSILSGCATLPNSQLPLNQHLSWQDRQNSLQKAIEWNIEGAIAAQMPQKSFSATINWDQSHLKNQYSINLFGPLGIGTVIIQRQHNTTILKDSNQQTYLASNPEQLIQQHLGWQLPVSNLYYWIRGLPAPNIPAKKQFDHYNHLTCLQQQGWQVKYLQYTMVNNIDLPSKIFLKFGDLQLRIVINHWKLP